MLYNIFIYLHIKTNIMETIKYAIIDDDELLHKELLTLMEENKEFECVAEFFDIMSAAKAVKDLNVKMIFLDMEMKNSFGFELMQFIDKSVKVVVVSSHGEYALEGYNYKIIDFVTKPIRPIRLLNALTAVKESIEIDNARMFKENSKNDQGSYILVSIVNPLKLVNILRSDIHFVRKDENHCYIYTYDKSEYIKYITLKEFIKELSIDEFVFVNKSYIVNIKSAITPDGLTIKLGDELIRISSSDKHRFRRINVVF